MLKYLGYDFTVIQQSYYFHLSTTTGTAPHERLAQLSQTKRLELLAWLQAFPMEIEKIGTFEIAMVTCGGVALRADDLYEIICERYERGSLIMTSNRTVEEWPELFGDPLLASASLDRLVHHSHIVTITGKSFRAKKTHKRKEGIATLKKVRA